mgnify:CR=1 FL=1|jgi:hypothetical protein
MPCISLLPVAGTPRWPGGLPLQSDISGTYAIRVLSDGPRDTGSAGSNEKSLLQCDLVIDSYIQFLTAGGFGPDNYQHAIQDRQCDRHGRL